MFVFAANAGEVESKIGSKIEVIFWSGRVNGQALPGGSILIAGAAVSGGKLAELQVLPTVYSDDRYYMPVELQETLRGILIDELAHHQLVEEPERPTDPLGSRVGSRLAVAAADYFQAAAYLCRLGYTTTEKTEPRLAREMRRYDQELSKGWAVPEPPLELIVRADDLRAT